jgi:hypothetical protein
VVGQTARPSQHSRICDISAVGSIIGLFVLLNFSNREGGLVRLNIGAVVRKEFRHPDAVARVSKLIEIYKLLKFKQVPNVDTLEHAETREHYPYVVLSPVGYDVPPSSGSEAFNAVVCVLEALKVRHGVFALVI